MRSKGSRTAAGSPGLVCRTAGSPASRSRSLLACHAARTLGGPSGHKLLRASAERTGVPHRSSRSGPVTSMALPPGQEHRSAGLGAGQPGQGADAPSRRHYGAFVSSKSSVCLRRDILEDQGAGPRADRQGHLVPSRLGRPQELRGLRRDEALEALSLASARGCVLLRGCLPRRLESTIIAG